MQDSREYLQAADNIYSRGVLYSEDHSADIHEEAYTRRPPGYPVFLGIALITGSVVPVFLVQMLFSLFSVFLVYRMFSHDGRWVWFAALMLLMTPAQFIYSAEVMAEIPFQLLLVLMGWSMYRFMESPDRGKYLWLFNLWLTLAMATKPVLFPLALIWLPVSLTLFILKRKTVFLTALLVPVLWISGYTIRNQLRTGSMQYSSIQTTNLLNYNLRYYLMQSEGAQAAADRVDDIYESCGNKGSYRLQTKCLKEGARKVMLERPLSYAWFHLKGCLRFFLDPGRFDLAHFFQIGESDAPGFLYYINQQGLKGIPALLRQQGPWLVGMLALILFFKIIKLAGFFLYLFKGREAKLFRWMLFGLVAYLSLITGPLGASRFILPVELLMTGAAAQGWVLLLFKKPGLRSLHVQDPENL